MSITKEDAMTTKDDAPAAPADDDLVARLRGWKHAAIRRDGSTLGIMREAADEIAKLRLRVSELESWRVAVYQRAERAEANAAAVNKLYGEAMEALREASIERKESK